MNGDKKLLAPHHPLPQLRIVDRVRFILYYCRKKRVLHLGCADWPHTQNLLEKGELLHERLNGVCALLAGVDISRAGISLLSSRGYKNLFVADASRVGGLTGIVGWEPEIIVAGEILEHVDAPGPMLKRITHSVPSNCILLITVPNALSIKKFLHVSLGYEKVSSDHVSYYSYATMSNLLSRSGLEISDSYYYKSVSDNLLERLIDILLSPVLMLWPYLGNGLIFCCRSVC